MNFGCSALIGYACNQFKFKKLEVPSVGVLEPIWCLLEGGFCTATSGAANQQ